LEAAQVDDRIDMFDHHRAFLHAGPAGRAGPQRVGMDHRVGADQRPARPAARLPRFPAGMMVAGIAEVASVVVECCGQILDQLLRIERLARGIGRTGGFAPPALDAGVEAEQPVPGEVARRLDSQPVRRQIDRPQAGVAPGSIMKTRRARMGHQMQGASDGMLQGTVADAKHDIGQGRHRHHDQDNSPRSRQHAARRLIERGKQTGQGIGDQRQWQTGEPAARQFGRAHHPPTIADHQPAGQHHPQCCGQQQPDHGMSQHRERQRHDQDERGEKTARGQGVEARIEGVAADGIMHIDEIAAGQRPQTRRPIHICRPPGPPPPRPLQRRHQTGQQQQDRGRGERGSDHRS
jgi:hypothetical protein